MPHTAAALRRLRPPRPTAGPAADGAAPELDRALAPVKDGLEAVSAMVLAELADPVARTVVYLIAAGGKRLRPALVLLAGASGPAPNRTGLIEIATAVELIHTATLIHDDIIDRSPLRRAQPTFHHRWGTERAVLMGDYLHATAFTLIARQDSSVMQAMADVCRQLCRGELREVEARYRLDLTEAEYLDIIRDKTASLIGGCCRCGAYLGGCDDETAERLAAFGMSFGLAFQIIDDCLDLSGDERQLGKSILTDLDKGALSLPVIYLARSLSERERMRLFAPLRRGDVNPAFLARVAAAARQTGAIAKAQERARAILQEGLTTLECVPMEPHAQAHGPSFHASRGATSRPPVDWSPNGGMNGLRSSYQDLADYAVTRRS